jgi:hypothetical protein
MLLDRTDRQHGDHPLLVERGKLPAAHVLPKTARQLGHGPLLPAL